MKASGRGEDPAAGGRGFTFVELLLIVAIIAILFSISTPRLVGAIDKAVAEQCAATRVVINGARSRYAVDRGSATATVSSLVESGYIKSPPRCTARGQYVWVGEGGDQRIFCSVHGQ